MAKKVSKNQRTDRMKNAASNKMAKIVVAEKKENGQYRYRQKIVAPDNVQAEPPSAQPGRYPPRPASGGSGPGPSPASRPLRSSPVSSRPHFASDPPSDGRRLG